MARDPKDPGTVDWITPTRGRPKKAKPPASDRSRAAAYRLRMKAAGGTRVTLNPGENGLVRESIRYALKHQEWDVDDRKQLNAVLRRLRNP